MTATGESAPAHIRSSGDGLAFVCPRCATEVADRFYGPCRQCRRQLVGSLGGDGRDVEVPRFEPPMHVTPNAVATKD